MDLISRTFTSSIGLLPEVVKHVPITVVGVGGIGSFTVLALAKMGFDNITVYDNDTVEEHNVDNQLYGIADIGKSKVSALHYHAYDLAQIAVVPIKAWFTGKEKPQHGGIIIIAVDSITARNDIWNVLMQPNEMLSAPIDVTKFFVDARMGAEVLRIFTVRPDVYGEADMYKESLHPQDESIQALCTEKSIMYTPFVAGGLVAAAIKKFVTGTEQPQELGFSFQTNEIKERWLHAQQRKTLTL